MSDNETWRAGLALLSEQLPVGIFVTTASGSLVFTSERFQDVIGLGTDHSALSTDDVASLWRERIHSEDRDRIREAWAACLHGAEFDETYRLLTGEQERWVRVRASGTQQAEGVRRSFVGTAEDVTDLREMHQRWGDRELMLDAVLSNSSDLVVVINELGQLSFISDAVERMLGYRPEYWLGRNVFDLLHPDDVGKAAESMATTVGSGAGVKKALVVRVSHADGSWRQIEIIANNLVDVEHVGGLLITARDISERLEAEALTQQASDRFEQAFDRAPIGMALITNDGHLLRANEALATMVGAELRELTGESVFSLTHPEDREQAIERAVAVLVRDDPDPVELRFLRRNGHTAWARVTSTVIRNDEGSPQHTVAHFEDVTEQRLLHEQLEEAAAHDSLTGLLNRAGFANRFAEATASSPTTSGALLIIDLDGFKAVNDAHGHAAGDELLQAVAARLVDSVRVTDLVGRLGGDEFAIYQPDARDASMVVALGERVRVALASPFRIEFGWTKVSGSIGVALLDGAVNLATALAAADSASYAAKHSGGDRVELTWCTELGLARSSA